MASLITLQQQLGEVIKEVQSRFEVWYPGVTIDPGQIYDFIWRAANLREMIKSDVFTVIEHEGGWQEPCLRNYSGEPAWGPLQLHVVAEDYRAGFEYDREIAQANPCNGYVGDQFICKTGLHPSWPRAYKMAVEFGLDYAIYAGTWAAWYGARFLPGGRFTEVTGKPRGFSEEAKTFAGLI